MRGNWELLPGERLDELCGDSVRIIQNPKGFCFGTDAVLLAHFAHPAARGRVMDLCAGNGAIGLILLSMDPGIDMTFVDVQHAACDRLRRSLAGNGQTARVLETDLTDLTDLPDERGYDAIVCNPPYRREGTGMMPEDEENRLSRFESTATLDTVITTSAKLLRVGGTLSMVLPAFRAAEGIGRMMTAGVPAKKIREVLMFSDQPAKLVLLQGVRGAGTDGQWPAPLIVWKDRGVYSDEVARYYNGEE